MGVREGLLVLLMRGSNHGYQLKLDFEQATGSAWTLNVGQVYSTLQRLERDELVEAASSDDEGRIAYRLTDAGRAEAEAWLDSPVERRVSNRDELSMKLLLVIATGSGNPAAIIDAQRTTTMTDLQDYTALRSDTDSDDLAWHLHLDRLALRSEAELRWLDRVERRLDEHPPPALQDGHPSTTTPAEFDRSEPDRAPSATSSPPDRETTT